jgi:LPS export ABC transporter protein LptC
MSFRYGGAARGGGRRKRFSKKNLKFPGFLRGIAGIFIIGFTGCSFDYGDSMGVSKDQPDVVMRDVEYVRVRDGNPVVRFQAQLAERYEERQTMELRAFSFEQFEAHGDEANAVGSAGLASVELDSGNIVLDGGVKIAVESEDLVIETKGLRWQDRERILTGQEEAKVDIQRSDGTSFSGKGFQADMRNRTWVFESGVEGTYIYEDEDEEAGVEEDPLTGDYIITWDDQSGAPPEGGVFAPSPRPPDRPVPPPSPRPSPGIPREGLK